MAVDTLRESHNVSSSHAIKMAATSRMFQGFRDGRIDGTYWLM